MPQIGKNEWPDSEDEEYYETSPINFHYSKSKSVEIQIVKNGSPKITNEAFGNSAEQICVPIDEERHPSFGQKDNNRIVIHVEDANKFYGKFHVLKNFNMVVQENTIYGLLGASGCGKTTILSCIVALRKLSSGNILVCGEPTGSKKSGIPGKKVGYMPQEIALNGECTIKEVLEYFGRIYGMSRLQITERHDYLINLLSLQALLQPIEDLSDGQKRRVSLAVALVHEPDILILDEPTVGCDPLLRDSIWKFLKGLVLRNRATVLVTTHYIEEMRQADRIGIMRNGHLLCEDSPRALLQLYNETLLDTVVTKLCRRYETPGTAAESAENLKIEQEIEDRRRQRRAQSVSVESLGMGPMNSARNSSYSSVAEETPSASAKGIDTITTQRQWTYVPSKSSTTIVNRLHGLVVKNLWVLIRNFWFSLCLIMMPAITVLLFCIAVGSNPSDLRVGLVNFETNDCIGRLDKTTGNDSIGLDCGQPVDLSCNYLKAINPDIVTFISVDTVEEAIAKTGLREIWGYVSFGEDFSSNFFKRIVEGDLNNNETIVGSQITVQLDMTGGSIGLTLQGILINAYRLMATELLGACGIDAAGKDLPVFFGTPIFGKPDTELTEFMGPGIALGFIFFMCALQCGLTYIIEKKDGMLNRTLVSGVSTVEIMLSHFLVQLFIVALIQIVICFLIIHIVFAVPLKGSVVVAFLLFLLNSIAGMSLGFLLATFCDDEKYAMLLAMGTVFPNFLLAGLIWPLEGLPVVLQYIGFVLPCTLAGEALRSILLRGFSITHHIVWYGFVSCTVWIFVYWIIILIWHKLSGRNK